MTSAGRYPDDDPCDECCVCCGEDICLKRGIDPEGCCMQVVTIFLISTAAIIMNFFVGIPWLGFSPFGISQYILGNGIMVMMFTSYFKASCTKSFVPDDWDASQSDYPDCFLEGGKPKYCKVCKRDKPPRAHHCSTCGRCVMRMDHHCPWINNCVGQANHRYFLQFLFWTSTGCGYVILMAIVFLLQSCIVTQLGSKLRGPGGGMRVPGGDARNSTMPSQAFMDLTGCENMTPLTPVVTGIAVLISLVFGAMVSMLGMYQFYMALNNLTEIESWQFEKIKRQARKEGKYWENPYNRGRWLDNLSDICGRGPFFTWLIPCITPQLQTGTTYKFNTLYSKLRNPVTCDTESEEEEVFSSSRNREMTNIKRDSGGRTPETDGE